MGATVPLFIWLAFALLLGQPKLLLPEISSYQVGDQVPLELTVLNADMLPVRLFAELEADTRVVVLVVFGGAAATVPDGQFRGPLWCQDSFDDLSVQRALVNALPETPVEVIGVAIPPVFGPEKYGYPPDVFLAEPDQSPAYESALRMFIEKTVRLKESSLIPFHKLYFDPRVTLLSTDGGVPAGNPPWLGRLKWHLDPRRYGAPTIWILDHSGKVLGEPFWGNDYGASPPDVRYGFQDLKTAVEAALRSAP